MARLHATLMVAAVLIAVAGPAYAFQCPTLGANIDVALADATYLSEAKADEIRALREDGAQKHREGSHSAAVKVLKEALALLEDAGG